MAIEVILRDHVEHLGRRGEIVKVADGYARNYLLPRKLALAVTEENKKQIAREKAKADVREAQELSEAQALAARVEAAEITIARRVGEHDTLYGSVTSADIAEALAGRDVVVDRRRVHLADPLKTLGEHSVAVKIHRDVTANVRIKIVPAE